MNALFISRNSPFESIGGIERYVDNLINFFKDRSVEDGRLFLMLPTHKEGYVENMGSVTIYFEDSLFWSRNILISKKEIPKKAQLFSEKIIKIIEEQKIDIICAENFHTDVPAAYSLLLNMVTMAKKIPLVLQLHSFATSPLQTELINQLKWDRISCVSKSVAGDCYQKGTDINYLTTHYLGVNTSIFGANSEKSGKLKEQLHLAPENKIILTATRIIRGRASILKEKGIINLVEAFSKISGRYPNLKLLIAVGKPPEILNDEFNLTYEMLLGYIKLHNVEANTIIKMFTLDEMPDVYRGSDVFVLASENETFGQVFIEAMSCGLPVIGTKVGGIPEIISDSYNGYLIPPDDSSILAQKIEKLLNDPATREDFIKAGLKTIAEKFTSEQQFVSFEKMLQEVVADFHS